MDNPKLEWKSPEFDDQPKDFLWYWMTILIAVVILGIAVWQRNFLFGVFVVIAEVLILVWAGRTAPMIAFALTEKELKVGGVKTYLLKDIKEFCVNRTTLDPKWSDLILYFHGYFRPPFRMKIPEDILDQVRAILERHMKEVEFEPSVIDSIEKWSGF